MHDQLKFLKFCENLVPYNYSQHCQDAFAIWTSGLKRNGYFVEFGALNGKNVSNSYLMECLGWDGIVAEPHPNYADILKSNRKCNVSTDCVWIETGGIVSFKAVQGRPALSTISSVEYDDIQEKSGMREKYVEHKVPTITLTDLLNQFAAPKQIDFLSIDTEGSELDILTAFDFNAYTFGVIVVEHGFSSKREPLYDLLTSHGYVRVWPEISDHDDWYVHASYFEMAKENASKEKQFLKQILEFEDSPGATNRLRRLRNMYADTRQMDDALRLSVELTYLDPDNAVVKSECARSLAQAGLFARAVEMYNQALEIDPNLKTARNQLTRLIAD